MIRNIQALRALAVFMVFLQHCNEAIALTGFNVAPLNFGRAGVDIFFVISGFIMVITTDTRETRPMDFARHRIVRIVPIYWLITFALFAVTLAAPHIFQKQDHGFGVLVKSLFFIPNQSVDGLIHPILYVGWTLNYEMFFYLLFTISLLIRQRTIRFAAMIAALAVLSVAGILLPHKNVPELFYTDPIMLEFGAGVLLGAFWSRMPALDRDGVPLAFGAIVLGCALMVLQPSFWPDVNRAASFGVPAFLIVGAALLLEKTGLSAKAGWVLLIGNASYSIYLTHTFVTVALYKIAVKRHLHAPGPVLVTLLVSAALVAIVGILTHWYVEKPLVTVFKRRKPALAPA